MSFRMNWSVFYQKLLDLWHCELIDTLLEMVALSGLLGYAFLFVDLFHLGPSFGCLLELLNPSDAQCVCC